MPGFPRRGFAVALCLLALGVSGLPGSARADDLLVFAAASLKNALDDVVAAYRSESGDGVAVSYAGTPALAKQVENGAPADLFVSADEGWMDQLQDRGAIRADTRVDLLGNRLVLVAPASSEVAVDLAPGLDLAAALGDGRLAIAEPDSVPAGRYGKAALQALGAWDAVRDRLAPVENVRVALALVSRGEAPLGVVYDSDARADPGVRVVAAFPAGSHPPIIYPAAVTAASDNPEAARLLAFMRSAAAAPLFERWGFAVLGGR